MPTAATSASKERNLAELVNANPPEDLETEEFIIEVIEGSPEKSDQKDG